MQEVTESMNRRRVSSPRLPPGKTAKMYTRHYVVHDYHDHSRDTEDEIAVPSPRRPTRGGVVTPFPLKLHQALDQVEIDGLADIISWQPHGRCFVIHDPKLFVEQVMPRYFNQTKLTSFQRQLNLYGFVRLTRGPDAGGYYHECFLRGKPLLTRHLVRTRVKGTKVKGASNPAQEPDFYAMMRACLFACLSFVCCLGNARKQRNQGKGNSMILPLPPPSHAFLLSQHQQSEQQPPMETRLPVVTVHTTPDDYKNQNETLSETRSDTLQAQRVTPEGWLVPLAPPPGLPVPATSCENVANLALHVADKDFHGVQQPQPAQDPVDLMLMEWQDNPCTALDLALLPTVDGTPHDDVTLGHMLDSLLKDPYFM